MELASNDRKKLLADVGKGRPFWLCVSSFVAMSHYNVFFHFNIFIPLNLQVVVSCETILMHISKNEIIFNHFESAKPKSSRNPFRSLNKNRNRLQIKERQNHEPLIKFRPFTWLKFCRLFFE